MVNLTLGSLTNQAGKSNSGWILEHDQQQLAADLYAQYIQPMDSLQDFELLSTIRYDPHLSSAIPTKLNDISESNFFLLREHYHRLQYTLDFFSNHIQGNGKIDLLFETLLSKLIEAFEKSHLDITKSYKVRFLVKLNGEMAIELYETPERNLLNNLTDNAHDFNTTDDNIWDVFIDSQSTLISPFTSFKTTYRKHYSDARQRMLPGNNQGLEEVIVWNTQHRLMEGSISNFAINVDGTWITPELSCGCLCGVMRHFLLKKGYIKEGVIKREDINVGDQVLLFNAIMGVVKGRIKLLPEII